ncbi:MAG: F0F1 ATP synthase subunit delta [Patescibacteria group bacterium]
MKYSARTYAQAYLLAVAGKSVTEIGNISRRFWELVWRHKHFSWRQPITAEIQKLWLEHHSLTAVDVATARPLTEAVRKELSQALAELVQKQVELVNSIKPHLLGGTVLTIGDTRLDASLKGRIDDLYNHLTK